MHRIHTNTNESLWVSILAPFLVAALTYFVFGKLDELKKRKMQSRLGAAIISTLEEEVNNGLNTMNNVFNNHSNGQNLLPFKSWQGINTVGDEVLIRILEVTKNSPAIGFPASEIRIHTKNYFDHMVQNWNDAFSIHRNNEDFTKYVKNNLSTYPESAEKVLDMLKNIRNLLEENSSRIWPK